MAKTVSSAAVVITPPNMHTISLDIEGTAPLVINRFGSKAREQMERTQGEGQTARGKRKREPKDFDAIYRDSLHVSTEGWHGINASAFRQAAISACRLVGFKMTYAKLAIFIEADGQEEDGTQLVKITSGEPTKFHDFVKNQTGVADIRPRGHWVNGWTATVRVRFDADQFTAQDIMNLFDRIGQQVGIGAGRPDSSESAGQGWGLFRIKAVREVSGDE